MIKKENISMIKIERDNIFLLILLLFVNVFFFFIGMLLCLFLKFQLLFIEKGLLVFVLSFLFFFFIKVDVFFKEGKLYLKNIYGFTVKEIDLKKNKRNKDNI